MRAHSLSEVRLNTLSLSEERFRERCHARRRHYYRNCIAGYALAREILHCAQEDTKKANRCSCHSRAKAAVAKNPGSSSESSLLYCLSLYREVSQTRGRASDAGEGPHVL